MYAPPAGTATPTEIDLPIAGMTCASCVNRIERFLRKTDGVEAASVNLATETATIRYLPGLTGRAELARTIQAAGYDLKPAPSARERAAQSGLRAAAAAEDGERAAAARRLLIEAVVAIGRRGRDHDRDVLAADIRPDGDDQPDRPGPRHVRPALGRPAVLCGRLASRAPWRRDDGYARRRRHDGCLGVQRRRDAQSSVGPRGRSAPRDVLRQLRDRPGPGRCSAGGSRHEQRPAPALRSAI